MVRQVVSQNPFIDVHSSHANYTYESLYLFHPEGRGCLGAILAAGWLFPEYVFVHHIPGTSLCRCPPDLLGWPMDAHMDRTLCYLSQSVLFSQLVLVLLLFLRRSVWFLPPGCFELFLPA